MIKILIFLTILLPTLVFADDKTQNGNFDLKNYVLSENDAIENAKTALKNAKTNTTDVIHESIFLKNNGSFGNDKLLAKKKLLKQKKMSDGSANMIYLQSISFTSASNWSIIVNNTPITNKMERNMSDVMEILDVSHNSVLFKILYPKPENIELDRKIKIVKDASGAEILTISLSINEFLNLSTFKVSNGNIIDGSGAVS